MSGTRGQLSARRHFSKKSERPYYFIGSMHVDWRARMDSNNDLDKHPRADSGATCIGVFDSGIGGLSVLRALRQRLPAAPLLYIADSAHAPYGGRSTNDILERSTSLVEHLLRHDV